MDYQIPFVHTLQMNETCIHVHYEKCVRLKYFVEYYVINSYSP